MRWERVHRFATMIVGAQLVVWATTGFAFTLFDFRVVRGTDDRAPAMALDLASVRVSPAQAAAIAGASTSGNVDALHLRMLDGRAVYEVAGALVDASDGSLLRIDDARAGRIATSAFRGPSTVVRVERRAEDERDVFFVHLGDARSTEIGVDATTGEVTSFRNRTYRLFDTLWSLHVLGYVDRHSPANWPLRIVGFFAAVAACSGAALLFVRLRRKRRVAAVLELPALEN
jgi:Na+-transporting NADH:ubiquinone oxidoreductase subunit F